MPELRFLPKDHYHPATPGYRLLPFRFMRWTHEEVLVVNDAGEFLFLDSRVFQALIEHGLGREEPAYRGLKSKHFLSDTPSTVPIELLATQYRTKKSFL